MGIGTMACKCMGVLGEGRPMGTVTCSGGGLYTGTMVGEGYTRGGGGGVG